MQDKCFFFFFLKGREEYLMYKIVKKNGEMCKCTYQYSRTRDGLKNWWMLLIVDRVPQFCHSTSSPFAKSHTPETRIYAHVTVKKFSSTSIPKSSTVKCSFQYSTPAIEQNSSTWPSLRTAGSHSRPPAGLPAIVVC